MPRAGVDDPRDRAEGHIDPVYRPIPLRPVAAPETAFGNCGGLRSRMNASGQSQDAAFSRAVFWKTI
jgi:hypothetical protein